MQFRDEENKPAGAPRTHPQKSDSASSFRINKTKAESSSSDQSQPSLVIDTDDRQVEMQSLLTDQQEQQHANKDAAQQAQHQQPQPDKQLLEEPPGYSFLQLPEQLPADASLPQHLPLLQLHNMQQTSQQQQQGHDHSAPPPSPVLHGIEQHQQPAKGKHWLTQEQILPRKEAPLQHHNQHPQQQQQQHQLVESHTSRQAGAVSHVTEADDQWSTTQLVMFSLRPSRLWAFLGLGIPGGLASSVQSAAGEVTTAMAGVLGRALFMNQKLCECYAVPCFLACLVISKRYS